MKYIIYAAIFILIWYSFGNIWYAIIALIVILVIEGQVYANREAAKSAKEKILRDIAESEKENQE